MNISRRQIPRYAMLFGLGLILIGAPLPGRAMSLFMGSEEPKPAAPPPKPVPTKPQAAPAQPASAGSASQAGTGSPTPATSTTGGPNPPGAQPAAPPAQAAGMPKSVPAPPATPSLAPVPPAPVSGPTKGSPQPATPVVAPPAQAAPAAPAADTVPTPATADVAEGYSYEPKSRRDPFLSLAKMIKVDKGRSELPPLQRIQISDVKLLGIIWGGYGYYGLVQTPDGKGYTVTEGMLMGTNNGVITSISSTAIIVSEPSVDITGKKTTKDIEILLRPKEVS